MKKLILLSPLLWILLSCNNDNKNKEDKTVLPKDTNSALTSLVNSPLLGSFVGPFGDNKITVLISRITSDSLEGRSIVGGNDRPFSGTYAATGGKITVSAKEPGDDKNDGVFSFSFDENKKDILSGSWKPNKEGEHAGPKEFSLNRRTFTYLQDVGQYPEASKRSLSDDELLSYSKDQLEMMRNEIFARHGYCFKKKNLRLQFEDKDWYIPSNTDVKDALTAVERKNISQIKKFEKYAEENGDEYGR